MARTLPRGWKHNVGQTNSEILLRNLDDPDKPTRKQINYLMARCEEYGLTGLDLMRFGVELGRLHPQHAGKLPSILESGDGRNLLNQLTRKEIGGLFEIVHAWQLWQDTGQTIFNRHEGTDTPYGINEGEEHAFPCPECGEEYGGVHIVAVRIAPHGDRNRPSAQIALSCE